MTLTPILLAATLIVLTALPAPAQVKKNAARRAAPVVAPLVLPPAASEQLAAATLIIYGDYACEFDKSLRVSLNPKSEGYVDLLIGKQLFTLKPVLSPTGALRLEDVRGRLLVVQIPVKSMVLDIQSGQRLIDECVHETQSENRRKLAAAPPLPGLGIDPVKAAAEAAAEAAALAASAAASAATASTAASAAAASAAASAAAPAPTASAAAAALPAASAASGAALGTR